MIDGKKLDNIEKQVESSGKRLGSILNVVKNLCSREENKQLIRAKILNQRLF
jgi:hypothetical protein